MYRHVSRAALTFTLSLLLFACASNTGGIREAGDVTFPHDKNYTLADFESFVEDNNLKPESMPDNASSYDLLKDDLVIEGYTFTELLLWAPQADQATDQRTYTEIMLTYSSTTDTPEKDFQSLAAKLKKRHGTPITYTEETLFGVWELGDNYFITLNGSDERSTLTLMVLWDNPEYITEK